MQGPEVAARRYRFMAKPSSRPSPGLPAEGEPDDERYSNDGQNDGYDRTSAPCRTLTYAGVAAPAAGR
jgi:hypothetical protein